MKRYFYFYILIVVLGASLPALAQEEAKSSMFQAQDTLAIEPDESADAQEMLDRLAWQPQPFTVTAQTPSADKTFDALITFDSPRPWGEPAKDRVVMEWYAARNDDGVPIEAPAVLVIHSLHYRMPFGRAIASDFARQGFHAFMMQIPGYGRRKSPQYRFNGNLFLPQLEQAVCDARRARDAIAVLPNIKTQRGIAIQGTSLGGFVATDAAALDGAFADVFLVLCGGDLADMFLNGKRDTAVVRRVLAEAGLVGEALRRTLWQIEPNRIAHRLDPMRTVLISATFDTVVPKANAQALARTIGLDDQHHLYISADHYTALAYLPRVINTMVAAMRDGE